jgi:putative transposase
MSGYQIPPEAEIASAVLVRKPSRYYLHVTCYFPKSFSRQIIGEAIAIGQVGCAEASPLRL